MPKAKDLTRELMTEIFITNAERIRLEHEESQEKFAVNCGMSRATYTRIINGKRMVDAAYSLLRLCVVYDIRIFDLFDIDDDVYRIAGKLNKLSSKQLARIEHIVDYDVNNNTL